MNTNKKRSSKSISRYSSSHSATAVNSVLDDEKFFCEIEALTKRYVNEAEDTNRKKIKMLRKLPMLLPEGNDPLNTILICRHPEERILILREMDDSEKNKKRRK